jgi:predicted amidophosphoribosyltransferase
VLLPVTCPGCGERSAAPVCATCADDLRPAPVLPAPPGVDACTAVLAYDGAARELVARLKYRNHRTALAGLAAAMAAVVVHPPDVVTWAPTTADRRRARGFDHAELLARAVARRLRRPCRPLLLRRPGPPQTGRSLADRRLGPRLVGVALRRPPGHVLVVDDVVTSGATASAAAVALRAVGVGRVDVLAAARTPPPRRAQVDHAP